MTGGPMAALVVHASKQGDSSRILFASPVLAHAKARGLLKAGWEVHVTDSDGRVFQPDRLEDLLKFDRKPSNRF
jgi:hypothetical protein